MRHKEKYSKMIFFFFFFLNVDISLIMYVTNLKSCICITNSVVEGTVSQIFYIVPGSFSRKSRKNIQKK